MQFDTNGADQLTVDFEQYPLLCVAARRTIRLLDAMRQQDDITGIELGPFEKFAEELKFYLNNSPDAERQLCDACSMEFGFVGQLVTTRLDFSDLEWLYKIAIEVERATINLPVSAEPEIGSPLQRAHVLANRIDQVAECLADLHLNSIGQQIERLHEIAKDARAGAVESTALNNTLQLLGRDALAVLLSMLEMAAERKYMKLIISGGMISIAGAVGGAAAALGTSMIARQIWTDQPASNKGSDNDLDELARRAKELLRST